MLHSATHASGSMPNGAVREEVESHDAQELIGGGEAAFEGGGAAGPLQSSVSLSSRRPLLLGEGLLSLWRGVVLELCCSTIWPRSFVFCGIEGGRGILPATAVSGSHVYVPCRRGSHGRQIVPCLVYSP